MTKAQVDAGILRPVAHAQLKTRINHTDLLTVDVTFPSKSDKSGIPAGRFPAVVFVQDEGVAPEAYRWLTDAIASWDFIVAVPRHVRDTPRFAPEDGSYTFDLLSSPPNGVLQGNVDITQVRLLGHGEGGRIGAKIVGDRPYAKFAMLGALPDGGDRGRLAALTIPWQDFVGTSDCKVAVAEAEAALGGDHVTALEDVSHEQFGAGASANPCRPTAPDETARATISKDLKVFLTGIPFPSVVDGGSEAGTEAGVDAAIDAEPAAADAEADAVDGAGPDEGSTP